MGLGSINRKYRQATVILPFTQRSQRVCAACRGHQCIVKGTVKGTKYTASLCRHLEKPPKQQ